MEPLRLKSSASKTLPADHPLYRVWVLDLGFRKWRITKHPNPSKNGWVIDYWGIPQWEAANNEIYKTRAEAMAALARIVPEQVGA
jgi:hypothetical protein